MKNRTDVIKKIKYHFNLNVYESKVWLALLSKNVASVGEIAEMSGVPRSRVYDVLESLEKQGFAISKLGKPVKYIAVKPAVVLDRLKNNILRDADKQVKVLSNIKSSNEYKELESLFKNGIVPVQPESLAFSIKGRANIYSHMKELIKEAKTSITLVTTPNALKRKAHFLKPLFDQLKTDGVQIMVASNADEDQFSKADMIHLSKQIGVPIKNSKVNGRFCLVDSSKALVILTPEQDDKADMAVLVDSPFFGKAFAGFLNPFWKS
ncbi:MAG: helix-turn-helix domain-containing protein [archaeon]